MVARAAIPLALFAGLIALSWWLQHRDEQRERSRDAERERERHDEPPLAEMAA
ncbi:MAG: hypothetical protein J2P30_00065 [Actinobacteria bacterium]|nr:hypothetical protein [Actinomycetota bacterium]